MHTKISDCITSATAKGLATAGSCGLNVVPVSMLKVNDDGSIWLFDFFMDKTAVNIQSNPEVALTCWSEMVGVQIKATAVYQTSGDDFDASVAWVATQNPSRVVKGLLILSLTAVFDISPGGSFSNEELSLN